MSLKYTFDGKESEIDLPVMGEIKLQSNPFSLYYLIQDETYEQLSLSTIRQICKNHNEAYEEVLESVSRKKTKTIESTANSDRPLSEIDGLLAHEVGKIKIEVRKGKVFLMDKSIDEYLE